MSQFQNNANTPGTPAGSNQLVVIGVVIAVIAVILMNFYVEAKALFSEDVLEETWASINESHTIIADLTYKHPDVFYKIGIAQTLGKYIILITQHARDIPHDFRHFPHIVYDNNAEGLQKLEVALIRLLAEAS